MCSKPTVFFYHLLLAANATSNADEEDGLNQHRDQNTEDPDVG